MRNVFKKILSKTPALFSLLYLVSPQLTWAMAQPGTDGQKSPGGPLGLFMPLILVFLIFYLLLIRPQAKQQKKHQQLLNRLERGDDVVTAGGIHGRITAVTDETVQVEVAEHTRIKVDKKQITRVLSQKTPEPKK